MSAAGDLAPEATTFYKRLASLLGSKWGDEYCVVMGWLHCRLCFLLLRSAITCVRGARSSIDNRTARSARENRCSIIYGSSIVQYHKATPPLHLVRVESNIITENCSGNMRAFQFHETIIFL